MRTKMKNEFKEDLARHNWWSLEWHLAGLEWFLTFISTGHMKPELKSYHEDMDRFLFNADWNDPYLIE